MEDLGGSGVDITFADLMRGIVLKRKAIAIGALEWLRVLAMTMTIPAYMGIAANYHFTSLRYWGILLISPVAAATYMLTDWTDIKCAVREFFSECSETLVRGLLTVLFGSPFGIAWMLPNFIPDKVLNAVGGFVGLLAIALASSVSLFIIVAAVRSKLADLSREGRRSRRKPAAS